MSPEGDAELRRLFASIAEAAATAAARPRPAAAQWRRGRRRRRARLAARGAGAVVLAGTLLAGPRLVGDGFLDPPTGLATPAPSPSAPPTQPTRRVAPYGAPGAEIQPGNGTWALYTMAQDGRLCVYLSPPGGGVTRAEWRDGTRLLVPVYECDGDRIWSRSGFRAERVVQLLLVRAAEGTGSPVRKPGQPLPRTADGCAGVAGPSVARVRLELLDGRTVDLTGRRLVPVQGAGLKFWATSLDSCARLVRVAAYGADGRLLGQELFDTDATGPAPRPDLLHPGPGDGRIVDLSFGASVAARERVRVLTAVEGWGARIEYARGNRYILSHAHQGFWDPVRHLLVTERAAGRLRFTMIRGSLDQGPTR